MDIDYITHLIGSKGELGQLIMTRKVGVEYRRGRYGFMELVYEVEIHLI